MQDLGRIIIDINEKGAGGKEEGESGLASAAAEAAGGGAAEAAGEVGKMAALAEFAGAAFAMIGAAIEVTVVVIKEVAKALSFMHSQIMTVASSLHDYSPAIALAEMDNQLKMMSTKFRMGGVVGAPVAGYMSEVGRMERTFVEIQSLVGGIFAVVLRPLLKIVNTGLDWFKTMIPAIIEGIAKIIDAIGIAMNAVGIWLFNSGIRGLGAVLFTIGPSILQMAKDVRAMKINSDKAPDFSAINQGFINDLRLMGAKI